MIVVRNTGAARPSLVAAVVAVAAAWPFIGTLHADFVDWDDGISIFDNPFIRSLDGAALRWMFTDLTYNPRFMPLTWLDWAITYHFVGLDPFAYHAGNVVLHSANAVLVCWLLQLLLCARGAERDAATLLCAATGSIFWAVHPLRTEPVAWATDRSYEQALFFGLIAALLYLRAATRPSHWALAGSVSAFCLSVLSYPICLGFAVVPLVLDFYPLRRLGTVPLRRLLAEKLPYFVAAATALAITLVSRTTAPPSLGLGPIQSGGLFSAAMKAAYMWTYYVWRPLFPVNLSPVYTDLLDFNPWSGPFLASAAFVVLVTALAVRMRASHPGAAALWACHLVLLVPVLGVTERLAYPSDRYTYVEGVVWAAAAAFALHRLLGKLAQRRGAVAAVALGCLAVLATLGTMSSAQAQVWTHSGTLFTHILGTLGDDPYRYNIFWRLGRYHMNHGARAQAIDAFDRTLEGIPNHFEASDLRGILALEAGQAARATTDFRAALTTRDDADVRVHLGVALAAQGRAAEAIAELERAVTTNPRSFEGHRMLATLLPQQGERAKAIGHAARAVELRPADTGARQLLEQLSALPP